MIYTGITSLDLLSNLNVTIVTTALDIISEYSVEISDRKQDLVLYSGGRITIESLLNPILDIDTSGNNSSSTGGNSSSTGENPHSSVPENLREL